jgi:hypothetical protein
LQAKQSSVAPVAGALLLRFLGAAAAVAAVLTVAVVVEVEVAAVVAVVP